MIDAPDDFAIRFSLDDAQARIGRLAAALAVEIPPAAAHGGRPRMRRHAPARQYAPAQASPAAGFREVPVADHGSALHGR